MITNEWIKVNEIKQDSYLKSFLYEDICNIIILNNNNLTFKIWHTKYENEFLSSIVLSRTKATQFIFDKTNTLDECLNNLSNEILFFEFDNYHLKINFNNQSYENNVNSDNIINWLKEIIIL